MESTSCRGFRLRFRLSFWLCFWMVTASSLLAAVFSSPLWAQRAVTPLVVRGVGRATVPVDGAWQFHAGDDPRWADPELDDSGWASIEVGRAWEGQGHADLTGFAWYRRHIVLATDTNTNPQGMNAGWNVGLLLDAVEDAAEVYWNGRLVGSYGKVPPDAVWYGYTPRPFPFVFDLGRAKPEPAGLGQAGPDGAGEEPGVLAIRVWKAPYAYQSYEDMGGLTQTPLLGSVESLEGLRTTAVYEWLKSNQYMFGLTLLSTVVSLLALMAWMRDRRQWMLFWLAAYMARPLALQLSANLPWVSWRVSYGTVGTIFSATDAALWILLLYLLGLRDNRRVVQWTRVFACMTVGLQILEGSEQLFDWTRAPHFFLGADVALTIPCLLVQLWGIVLIGFAFRKRLDAARWMVAIAALLVDVLSNMESWFDLGMRWTHWKIVSYIHPVLFTVWGNAFDILTIATTLLVVAIVYAVWRYEAEQRQRQSLLHEEYRNAQELQQVLVPETLPEVRGYAVTSAYRPAQGVGGDFVQVIELRGGSALAVVGDVSGKGLKAAMTVALIVGALRSLAETTEDAAEILEGLNRRLIGRLPGGFVTCLVVWLDANGECVMANAGHLAPFLNGDEVSLPAALPLGIVADAAYETTVVRLGVGDRLTLYTDGLVEARNAAGELFGFARVAELMAAGPDAGAAAEAAVRFGQEDDVTVLSLCYVGGLGSGVAVQADAGLAV